MDAYRVLVLAPTRRDREATLELLKRNEVASFACDGAQSAALEIENPVGAMLMTDSAFSDPRFGQLIAALLRQPPWSEIPIILLCRSDPSTPSTWPMLDFLRNVT